MPKTEAKAQPDSDPEYAKLLMTSRRLLADRDEVFSNLTAIHDRVTTLQLPQLATLQAYVSRAEKLNEKFETIQSKMKDINFLLQASDQLEINQVSNSFTDLIVHIESRYLLLKKQEPPPPSTADTHISTSPHPIFNPLPRIPIPQFAGNIDQWPEFHSTYKSRVHDVKELSQVQKFQYLKSAITGEAAAVISGLSFTEENYLVAYNALVSRYANPRRIAAMYLSKITSFKRSSSPSLNNLRSFLNVHQNSVSALKASNLSDLCDFLLFSISLQNLDPVTARKFEDRIATSGIPTYQQLIDFVVSQVQILELSPGISVNTHGSTAVKEFKSNSKQIFMLNSSSSLRKPMSKVQRSRSPVQICVYCRSAHSVFSCPQFAALTIDRRYDFIRQQKKCFNCFGSHVRQYCKSKSVCRLCNSNSHHTLLHSQVIRDSPTSQSVNNASSQVNSVSTAGANVPEPTCLFNSSNPHIPMVLLGTLTATIMDSMGQSRTIRAVIDPGSQVSVVTQSCVHALGLFVNRIRTQVSCVGNTRTSATGITGLTLHSRVSDFKLSFQALVMPSITPLLPAKQISSDVMSRFRHLALADPTFDTPSPIDILLGADVFPQLLLQNSYGADTSTPSAISTQFGWIILGPLENDETFVDPISLHMSCDISAQLQNFWAIEEIPTSYISNPDDDRVEEHFSSTHTRTSDGRYVVALPFKTEAPTLTVNAYSPIHSLNRLENKLNKIPSQFSAYNDFMREYLSLQHMSNAITSAKYIIPHHVVWKTQKDSCKIRVVFNASAKDLNNISLNDCLMSGPKLQRDIHAILLSFRLHAVALCADIEKMYRQILVRPEDRVHQHIVCRTGSNATIQEMELNTVTYGLTPSAFLAQRVLIQLAHDEGERFPLASQALQHCTYVDDIITGAPDIDAAQTLRHQLIELLNKGGFTLKKWSSNHSDLINQWQDDPHCSAIRFHADDISIKILGILWDPLSDTFRFSVSPFEGELSKRNLLSYIARIFDPLGFLAPITSTLKILLQQLWIANLDWDDPLPIHLNSTANKLLEQLPIVSRFSIPRYISHSNSSIVDIAGFCDASVQAYAAVLYIVFRDNDLVTPTLWIAKSRVAPLKTLTIPRLELCAALLLTRLYASLDFSLFARAPQRIHFFSDSRDVLHWLHTPPHLLNTFVSNRVVTIRELASQAHWAHVPTSDNPADLATRAILPCNFINDDKMRFWLRGPAFLNSTVHDWPAPFDSAQLIHTLVSPAEPQCLISVNSSNSDLADYIQNVSSLVKLKRVFAWITRFINNARAAKFKSDLFHGPLSASELTQAELTLVRITQRQYFPQLIRDLNSNAAIAISYSKLSPFLDSTGLVRVGGRLTLSKLSFHSKHPLLLPKVAHLSRLICVHFHVMYLHAGPNTVLPAIRSQFWILSLRSLLRQCIHSCITCHRFRAQTYQPLMAPLPVHRVEFIRPFAHVGVDFAGPFSTRTSTLRKYHLTKGYLCLFVCSASKALHLEFASDLSTKCFLAALDRFVARRGLPNTLYSDCGRNFVGASRELRNASEFLRSSSASIHEHLSARSVNWVFNPPYAPHFGGLWEAGVKSVKTLLTRLVGDRPCTAEEYFTLFARIEAVLNSRPLIPISVDPHESSGYLTPGHFLIGSPLLSLPELPVPASASIRHRWSYLQHTLRVFWKRWTREYLNSAVQRHKWNRPSTPVNVGDVVYIKSVNTSPLSWPLGRILNLFPGPDRISRVASIRTCDGAVTRPVRSLIPLPIQG